jgi:glycosyltransferase involved in cell wall biosynthesis
MPHLPRRIALTTPLLSMPPTYFVTEHAEELLRTGDEHRFRVHPLAARVDEGATDIPVVPAITRPRSYASRSHLAPAGIPLQAAAVIRDRPDLVHQHHGVWTAGAAAAAAVLRVPLVTTVHGTDMFTAAAPRPRGLQRVHRANSRLAFARSAMILAVSEDLRRVALAAGAPAERTEVHYQGIDTDTFAPSMVPPDAGRPPRVLYVGGLIPRKRVDLLIRASLDLARTVPHELHVIGDGPLRGELERLAEGGDHIRFAGSVGRDDVLAALRSGAVLVLPSLREAAGLVLLEAQACGLPVVVTGGDGKAEMLRPGVTGAVVGRDPEPAELARALREWLPDSPSMQREVAEQARDFVVRERSVRVGAERLAAIYESVLG